MNKKLILLLALNALMPVAASPDHDADIERKVAADALLADSAKAAVPSCNLADLPSGLMDIDDLSPIVTEQPRNALVPQKAKAVKEVKGAPSRFSRFKTWVASCLKSTTPDLTAPLNKAEQTIIDLFNKATNHEKRYLRYLLEAANNKRTWEIVMLEDLILQAHRQTRLKESADARGYFYTATVPSIAKAIAKSAVTFEWQEVVTEKEIRILMRKTDTIKTILSTIVAYTEKQHTDDTYTDILHTFMSPEGHTNWDRLRREERNAYIAKLKKKKCGPYAACLSNEMSPELEKLDPKLFRIYAAMTSMQWMQNAFHRTGERKNQIVFTALIAATTYGLLVHKEITRPQGLIEKVGTISTLLKKIAPDTANRLAIATTNISSLPTVELATVASASLGWQLYNVLKKISHCRLRNTAPDQWFPRIVDVSERNVSLNEYPEERG